MEDVFRNWPFGKSIVWKGRSDVVNENIPLFKDLIDHEWHPDDLSAIVKYLEDGRVHCVVVNSEKSTCPLCDEWSYRPSLGRSDGVWNWPDSLSHFVANHFVRIPDAFVEHIRTMLKLKNSPSGFGIEARKDPSEPDLRN